MFIKHLRKYLKPVFWVLAALIVPAFVFWGIGSAVKAKDLSYVGKIFGKKLYYDEFKNTLNWLVVSKYGDNIHNISKYPTIYEEAWRRLILLEEAKKKNIRVSAKELARYIMFMPHFQRNNTFDSGSYRYLLTYQFGIDVKTFEDEARKTLMLAKLEEKIFDSFTPTSEQIREEYFRSRQSAKVEYIVFSAEDFNNLVTIDAAEVERYYATHSAMLKKPEQVDVEYIKIPIKPFEKEIAQPQEETITSYYETHKEEFEIKTAPQEEETLESKVKENIEAAKKELSKSQKKYTQLSEVREQIKKKLLLEGADKKAYRLIDEISEFLIDEPDMQKAADKFGLQLYQTGFFGSEESLKDAGFSREFSVTAFNLRENEISQILKIKDSYYILKLKSRAKAHIPSLEEAQNEIMKTLIDEKALVLAKESCTSYLLKIKEALNNQAVSFKDAATSLGLEVNESNYLTQDVVIPQVGISEAFLDTAFGLQPGSISEPIKIAVGYALIKVVDKKLPSEETFAKEKDRFSEDIIFKKKLSYVENWEKELIKKANLERNEERF
ncbi:MAG: SurA N-terminal domain-containing protein [Candidatus Omnitrophota bacterium]